MKLIYLTAKEYPGTTADHIYVRELAGAFYSLLGKNFLFVTAKTSPGAILPFPSLSAGINLRHGKSLLYFFWLPYFIFSKGYSRKEILFFLNDPNLLSILIFWKKLLRLKYEICSDWHMLFGGLQNRFIIRGSDYLVSTSQKLKDRLVSIGGIKPDKILVAYGGVAPGLFPEVSKNEARLKLGLPQNKKIIAYIGGFKTMGMEKGLDTVLESLRGFGDDMMAFFAGGKDEEIEEYRLKAGKLGVLDKVVFSGRYDFPEAFFYQGAADILIIPYPDSPHFREYGFPMKVYEYMASRRPIIYSKLDLVEEVIGEFGCPFIPDNHSDFARAVREVLSDYPKWENKARFAYDKLKQYSWEKKAESIINFLSNDAK